MNEPGDASGDKGREPQDGKAGQPTSAPPYAPLTLRTRLIRQRLALGRSLKTVAWIAMIITAPIVLWFHTWLSVLFVAATSEATSEMPPLVGSVLLVIVVTLAVLIGGAILVGLWHLMHFFARKLCTGRYKSVWIQLHHTGTMKIVVDENYIHWITSKVGEVFALRWISPPPPKRIEEQIEFAACYYEAYRKLAWGPERAPVSALWSGGLHWFLGQRACCCCGILIHNTMWPWILGGIFYVQRLGVMMAMIDFLLYDHEPYTPPSQPPPLMHPKPANPQR